MCIRDRWRHPSGAADHTGTWCSSVSGDEPREAHIFPRCYVPSSRGQARAEQEGVLDAAGRLQWCGALSGGEKERGWKGEEI